MYHIVRSGLVTIAMLVMAVPLALAQDAVAVGKKGEAELTSEVRFGSTLLKAGHYQFQHQLVDGQHYLVVREQRTARPVDPRWHYGGAAGAEVARLPCRLMATPTGKKTWETALYTKKEADGSRSITRVDIRGEKEGHVVTLEPLF